MAKKSDIPQSPESSAFENLTKNFSPEELMKMGEELVKGYDDDWISIANLRRVRTAYNKLFDMVYERKSYPFPDCANVKMPVITTACVNFQARAYMNIFPPYRLINAIPDARSPEDAARARRVTDHLNWQLTFQMTEFYPGSDRMLLLLARDGYAFKKTYFDSVKRRVVSDFVLPEDFVVNYYCKSLDTSYRYTHVLYMNPNDIKIKAAQGLYTNVEGLEKIPSRNPELPEEKLRKDLNFGIAQPDVDYTTPRKILEMHTYRDIDKSGILKPVVVLIDYITKQVIRITSRINPLTGSRLDYFTAYDFIPNPHSIYGYGFGMMIYGINETINTSTNQLLDAGHLQNIKGGFVSRQAKMKRGNLQWEMGKFIEIDGAMDDVRKYILPFEFGPPSTVLMNLLEYMQTYVEKLTTVTEIFTGGTPRSDTSATAASLAVEQGIKVFTAIQQRVHRALREEIRKIAVLNAIYLDEFEYFTLVVKGKPTPYNIGKEDYSKDLEIHLVSDPNIVSEQQNVSRSEALAQIVMTNPILAQNPTAMLLVTTKRMEAINVAPYLIEEFTALMQQSIDAMMAQQQAQQQAQAQQQQSHIDAATKGYKQGAADAHASYSGEQPKIPEDNPVAVPQALEPQVPQ